MLHNDVKRDTDEIISINTTNTPVNTIWESLKTSLLSARDLYVPSRMTSVRFSKPWITRECRRLIRIKMDVIKDLDKQKGFQTGTTTNNPHVSLGKLAQMRTMTSSTTQLKTATRKNYSALLKQRGLKLLGYHH